MTFVAFFQGTRRLGQRDCWAFEPSTLSYRKPRHDQLNPAHRLRLDPGPEHGASQSLLPRLLGMQSPDWDANWPEIETGNVSLYLVDPTAMGKDFAPHTAAVALRVPSVSEAKQELEARGLQFTGEHDSGVCNMALFDDTEGNSLMLHHRYAP